MFIKSFFRKGVLCYITDKDYRIYYNSEHYNMNHEMPDDKYLSHVFRYKMGYELNLKQPRSFNEKLQWLKLHDRRPEYTVMADKYEAKNYIANRIGKQYIIPSLGVWNHFDEIDLDSLPEQFILKCTHDSQSYSICRNKATWNKRKARKKLEQHLEQNLYYIYREWAYKDIKPRILAEKYMNNHGEDLIDYKIHNFNGVPKLILVCEGRFSSGNFTEAFLDLDWNILNVKRPGTSNAIITKKPDCLPEMLELSRILSKDIPFLRTDFYIIDGRPFIGELTFYPAAGLAPFEPESFDYELGSWLQLPSY